MCGICGFVSKNGLSLNDLKKMNDTMVNRGPDDSGEVILPFRDDYNIGLAQRRLSIMDLSEKGHQPFYSNDGRTVVVFNGEIYNFNELKRNLSDYCFNSNCDTETIVAAYEKWGIDFVNYIDGMFAIALFDLNKKVLYLVRDRIGKKPLYYSYSGEEFVFASVLKPFFEYPGFEKRINKNAIPRYLFNGYISGDECVLENVHKLRPGEMLEFDGRSIKRRFYWDLISEHEIESASLITDYNTAKEQLRQKLTEAVKKRLTADVPVGTFLSGGYDSSLVTAIAQSVTDTPIRSYSIGFYDKKYDEAPFAKKIAEHLGTDHVNHYVSEEEMMEIVKSIPEYFDEPFADSSQIPSMIVAQIAKRDVTVVLTGDGGDEFFCGYNMYEKLLQAQRIEPAARLFRFLPDAMIERLPFRFRAILQNDNDEYKTQFGRQAYEDSVRKMLRDTKTEIQYNESSIKVKDWQVKRMLLDSTKYLPDNNLCKVDRSTMRYSLEARCPILDIEVIRTSFRIPHKYKYKKKEKKYILKDLAFDYIPSELLDRPKRGFSVPIDSWMRGPLKDDLMRVTNYDYLCRQNIFDPEYTSNYVKEYLAHGNKGRFSGNNPSNIIWPLYVFQLWYERYMA